MILYLKQVDYELDKKLNDYDIVIDNEMIWPLVLKFKYNTVLTDTQFLFKVLPMRRKIFVIKIKKISKGERR